MAVLLFYRRPAPLRRDAHAKLRLRDRGFAHAAAVNSVPLVGVELPEASRSYPVLFAPSGAGEALPIALLGLRREENLFVADDGVWAADRYVPAFVRRHPFALTPEMDVVVDEAASGLSETEGEPLFEADGREAPALQQAVAFLRSFQDELERTRTFCAELQTLKLLVPCAIKVESVAGSTWSVDGLLRVDEAAFLALSDEVVLRWKAGGQLAWVYAHFASLSGLPELNRRTAERVAASPGGAAPEAKPASKTASKTGGRRTAGRKTASPNAAIAS